MLVLHLAFRERRQALAWSLAVGAVLAVMLALKYSFADCTAASRFASLRSPSGHTASATMVYGGLAVVLRFGIPFSLVQALTVAVVIGGSRVLLHAHSVSEAFLGGLVGLLGATCLAVVWPPMRRPANAAPLARILVATSLGLAAATHGTHVSAERFIRRTAPWFWPLRVCVQNTPA